MIRHSLLSIRNASSVIMVTKSARAAKRARITIANLHDISQINAKKRRIQSQPVSLEVSEAEAMIARLRRGEETKQRNRAAQGSPILRKISEKPKSGSLEADAQAFYNKVDEVFLRVCASCGELANASKMTRKKYDQADQYFNPLRVADNRCDVVPEGITCAEDSDEQVIWLCKRCNDSLRKQKVPKFSRASGFRIRPVSPQLAVLNRLEARLIGLGISFTTCLNLYCDGQEFTRGNAVNYWNPVQDVVQALPRSLTKCGVVLLKLHNGKGERVFHVRPDLVRQALEWLIKNNSLYKDIVISEKNLHELAEQNVNDAIPSLELTTSEVAALEKQHIVQEASDYPMQQQDEPSTGSLGRSGLSLNSDWTMPDVTSDINQRSISLEQPFEMTADGGESLTEFQRIVETANTATGETIYHVGELTYQKDAINEYKTKMLMQNCFPTLFPDGEGGLNPLDGIEDRLHEYNLAEYCAHLMKWHDRRYVIRGNFKFFCLNFIQRRQIDGLVRRVNCHSINLNDPSDTMEPSAEPMAIGTYTKTALNYLESLKPYFSCVRGSGLYWANVRDELMSMIGNRVLSTRWPTFFLTLSIEGYRFGIGY